MRYTKILVSLLLVGTTTFLSAKIEPLPEIVAELEAKRARMTEKKNEDVSFIFFEENYASGGYAYMYGGNSKVFIPEESGKAGDVSLAFDLDPNEYSGGAVVLYGAEYNMLDLFPTGALEFWIKGAQGGEDAFVTLSDDELVDGVKTAVKVPLSKYGGVQPYWTLISIPLADFGRRGSYWDAKQQRELKSPFDWSNVKEFGFTISKGANSSFNILVDNVYVLRDKFPEPVDLWDPYWDEITETVVNHPGELQDAVTVLDLLYDNNFKAPMFGHVYGGKTTYAEQATDAPSENPHVMALYFDNSDYSGVSLNFGRSVDFATPRNSGGGLGFWAKAVPGVTQIFVGLADDDSDKRSVGTTLLLNDYGTLDTTWSYFMIPLKEFGENGSWWDESTQGSKPGPMDWNRIFEISFTTDKYGNRIAIPHPAKIYLDQIELIESIPGYVDPDLYWDTFVSNEPDRMLTDFENELSSAWIVNRGDQSVLVAKIIEQPDHDLRDRFGRWLLEFQWSINDWAFANYPLAKKSVDIAKRDWSKHSALAFDVYSNRDTELFGVRIKDTGKEDWIATVNLVRGWNTVILPFRDFRKYSYYQMPDALVDGKLDLSDVYELTFEPGEIGIRGTTIIDNVRLTQEPR